MKSRIVFLLVFMLCLGSFGGASALAEVNRPGKGEFEIQYVGTKQVKAQITDNSGSAKCTGILYLKSSNYKATITTKLQKKVGNGWLTVSGATWSKSGTGTGKIQAGGSKAMETGNTYRTYTSARVTDLDGNYIETVTDTSSSISY